MLDPEWKSDVDEKITALYANEIWELTFLPSEKYVSCR